MSPSPARIRGLRANALAAVVMLLIQYCLGISANLYATLPADDRGKSVLGAFGAAVGNGPVVVTLHALLGTLLLVTAVAAVVRSARLARVARVPLGLTGVGLLAILTAWISGARFVGTGTNGASLAMALATAVAVLCYVLTVVFTVVRTPAPSV